jgi:hypothetical protein
MDEDAREALKDAFQKPPHLHPVRILLATDTASEGIDLQRQCHRLVNYDIPFNPNRLEQRAGRIDRYGQSEAPEVFHFVGAHWRQAGIESYDADLEFLTRVAVKIHEIREDLGSVNPVLAEQVERHMLGRPDPVFNLDALAPRGNAKEVLKVERQLREDAERLHATLDGSRQALHATPADVHRVVQVALALDHQPALAVDVDPLTDSPVYRVGALTGSWARTTTGLKDTDYGWRPVSFDAAVAADRQDLVLAHLNHPLVAMATRLLRAEVWGQGSLARVCSIVVADPAVREEVLAAYSRLVLLGADGARIHEELFGAGGQLRGASFNRLGVTDLQRALDAALGGAATPTASPAAVQRRLAETWAKVHPNLHAAITARAGDREASLRKAIERRRDDEVSRVETLMGQFLRNLNTAVAGLGGNVPQQLSFADLDDSERRQVQQDIDALRARLKSLPAEKDAEVAAVRARYEHVTVRWFPAAVVHLVPARLAGVGR